MLEKIFAQQFKYKYLMFPPPNMLDHPNYIVFIKRIFFHELFKNSSFWFGKFMIDFCVSVYFKRDALFLLMIVGTYNLRETPLS